MKAAWACSSILALAAGCAPTLALAAADPAPSAGRAATLEELVVTARKREESAQSVPISLTALTGQSLEQRNVRSLADVARFTPNLTFDVGAGSAGGSSSANIYIRGVGQSEFNGVYEPGVGIYVDGVYFGRTVGSVMDILDLSQVEVLRGPQGTLFGKNTIGGAITLTSRRPSGDVGGFAEAEVGSFNDRGFKAAAEAPIVEGKLAARVAISTRRRDGYDVSRITGERQNDIDSTSGRAILRWTPSPDVDVTVIGDAVQQREAGQAQHLVAFTPGSPYPQLFSNLVASKTPYQAFDQRWLSPGQRYNFANGPSANDADGGGVSATADWRLSDNLTLTSVTAYRRLKTLVGVDVDGTPLDFQSTRLQDRQHQVSQEVRLSGVSWGGALNWLVGGYYYREHVEDLIQLNALPGLFNIALDQDIRLDNRTYAGFGQATLKLSPSLSVTVGTRYNNERKRVVGQSTNAGVVVLDPALARLAPHWTAWTPKASVEFKPSDATLLYASAAKGFKSGSVNYEVQRLADFQAFNPEKVTTYEGGFKSDWLGRRLRVNGAIFRSDYTDMQFKAVVQPGQYTCPTTVTTFCSIVVNAASVKLEGAELEVTARPVPPLELFAGLGWIHDHFDRIDPALVAGGVITPSSKIQKTPEQSASLGLQYDAETRAGDLTFRADYSYRSKTFTEIRNDPSLAQPGYGLLNLRLSLRPAGSRWELAVSGMNLTDERYITSGAFLTTGISEAAYGAPRTWMLSARYLFGSD